VRQDQEQRRRRLCSVRIGDRRRSLPRGWQRPDGDENVRKVCIHANAAWFSRQTRRRGGHRWNRLPGMKLVPVALRGAATPWEASSFFRPTSDMLTVAAKSRIGATMPRSAARRARQGCHSSRTADSLRTCAIESEPHLIAKSRSLQEPADGRMRPVGAHQTRICCASHRLTGFRALGETPRYCRVQVRVESSLARRRMHPTRQSPGKLGTIPATPKFI
jgi:hypothetical protein